MAMTADDAPQPGGRPRPRVPPLPRTLVGGAEALGGQHRSAHGRRPQAPTAHRATRCRPLPGRDACCSRSVMLASLPRRSRHRPVLTRRRAVSPQSTRDDRIGTRGDQAARRREPGGTAARHPRRQATTRRDAMNGRSGERRSARERDADMHRPAGRRVGRGRNPASPAATSRPPPRPATPASRGSSLRPPRSTAAMPWARS